MTQKTQIYEKAPRTYAIIGATFEVHRQLGCGFLEKVYCEALALEFDRRKIPYQSEVELPVRYKDITLRTLYKADFICNNNIILEIKAIKRLGDIEKAQILNYLKASELKTGLLLNFGATRLEYKRFVF